MANYPLKNKHYFEASALTSYPLIDFNKVYYTVIDGTLMAVKPLVGYFIVNEYKSEYYWLNVYAANGKNYTVKSIYSLYNNKEEYFDFVNNGTSSDGRIPRGQLRGILDEAGVKYDNSRCGYFYQYYWYKGSGTTGGVRGQIAIWFDKDGHHYELKPSDDSKGKLYISREQCIAENSGVLEFGDDSAVPEGTYTVVREFKVKAQSEKAANGIVDEAIGDKLCVTKK